MSTAVLGLHWLEVFILCFAHEFWPYLTSWVFVFYSCCSNFILLMWTIVCILFCLFLTFVLRYDGLCYTNVVFRLSLWLLGLTLSLYLVRILYFVVVWIIIRLHQSNLAHSTTCQNLLICKYRIPSSFQCCNLQHMSMLIQSFFLHSTILCEIWLWKESFRHDGQQLHQYQQNNHLWP